MINIIVAVGKNLEIGKDNKLIWAIPEDMRYFRETTNGKTVVMGLKTYESIGRTLPNRDNVVISYENIDLKDVRVITNYKEVLDYKDDVFIIGGESIYKLFLPYADKLFLTEIDSNAEADSYFPEFDKSLYNKKAIKTGYYNDLKYSFVIYERIK